MKRFLVALLSLALVAACNGGSDNNPQADATPDPALLLTQAAANIRAAATFRLEIQHSGAEYPIMIDINGVDTQVSFRRAVGQFVSPDELQAEVSVLAANITLELDIYARGSDQWLRFRSLGLPWARQTFVSGFNPGALIAEETGFQRAFTSLQNIQFVGSQTLEDGAAVYHISGTADGSIVTEVLVGLIHATGTVAVDFYIYRETGFPARLVMRQLDTVTETNAEPTTWTVDVYDINAESAITSPES